MPVPHKLTCFQPHLPEHQDLICAYKRKLLVPDLTRKVTLTFSFFLSRSISGEAAGEKEEMRCPDLVGSLSSCVVSAVSTPLSERVSPFSLNVEEEEIGLELFFFLSSESLGLAGDT